MKERIANQDMELLMQKDSWNWLAISRKMLQTGIKIMNAGCPGKMLVLNALKCFEKLGIN
ncbi:MAG: hypothetical protein ACTSRA_01210 [Promethearchaeota archaeon]